MLSHESVRAAVVQQHAAPSRCTRCDPVPALCSAHRLKGLERGAQAVCAGTQHVPGLQSNLGPWRRLPFCPVSVASARLAAARPAAAKAPSLAHGPPGAAFDVQADPPGAWRGLGGRGGLGVRRGLGGLRGGMQPCLRSSLPNVAGQTAALSLRTPARHWTAAPSVREAGGLPAAHRRTPPRCPCVAGRGLAIWQDAYTCQMHERRDGRRRLPGVRLLRLRGRRAQQTRHGRHHPPGGLREATQRACRSLHSTWRAMVHSRKIVLYTLISQEARCNALSEPQIARERRELSASRRTRGARRPPAEWRAKRCW